MRLTRVLLNAAAVAATVGGMLFTAPGALAGTVTIKTSGDGTESSLLGVLESVYGTAASGTGINQTSPLVFGNATLYRIQDWGGSGDLNIHTGGAAGTADDRSWKDGISSFDVVAKYAANTQVFGYDPTTPNYAGFIPLLTNAQPNDEAVGGPVEGSVFQWVLKSGGKTFYSKYSKNQDEKDHMVSWEVVWDIDSGRYGQKTWLLAWEDLPGSNNYDYQDLVVEVNVTVVPLPPAVLSGLAMLAGLGVFGWVRRRNRATFA